MYHRTAALLALGVVASVAGVASASAQGQVMCAQEGGYCRVPYPTTVIYGAQGSTTAREVGPRGIPCNNGAFGDPARGAYKRCFYIVRGYEAERRPERRRDEDRYERRRDERYEDRRYR